MDESDEEPEVEPALQQVRWKIEAIIIRAMKAAQAMDHNQLVQHTMQQWQSLNRPENMSVGFIEERLAYLVKREWFSDINGSVNMLDLSQK
jgi:hypothetical protein